MLQRAEESAMRELTEALGRVKSGTRGGPERHDGGGQKCRWRREDRIQISMAEG
jgi:hypothetical protein